MKISEKIDPRFVLFMACIVAMPALAGAGVGISGTPPPAPAALGHEMAPADDAPAPQSESALRAAQLPETGKAPVQGPTIDLRKVDRTGDVDLNQPPRFHLQGEFSQTKGRDLVRDPLTSTDHSTEESQPQSEVRGSAKAFGNYVTGWEAQTYSGWIPPDEVMAVGSEYIVEATNSGFSVWTKNGRQTTAYTDFEGFVSLPTGWNGFCYDPRVVYDSYSNRFVMTIMGLDQTNLKSYIFLMVSSSADPNGTWYQWRYDVSRGSAGTEEWLDFSSLGVDNWGIYFSGNYFTFAGSAYTSSRLWSSGRDFFTGSSTNYYSWSDLRWPNNNHAFSVQPAAPLSTNGGGGTFFVNTYSGSGTEICLWTLTGKRYPEDSNPDVANLTNVAISAQQYYAMGQNVNQPDNATDIDGGDARVTNAVYSFGKVYGVFGYDPDGDGSNCESYAIGLTTAGAKDWDYPIGAQDYYYSYPSIAVDGNGGSTPNWAVGMTITSDVHSIYPSTAVYVRDVATSTASFGYDNFGLGSYVRLDSSGRNRWGDYSLTAYDFTCDNVFSVQEYATASNTWATRIFGRTIGTEPACIYLHQNYPIGGETFTAGQAVSMEWDSLNLPASDLLYFHVTDFASQDEWYGGFSTSLSAYTWNVPNFDGTFSMYVGSWDGAAYSAQDTSDSTFTINGLPDLDVTTFSGATTANSGDSFVISNTVTNIGPVTATGTATNTIRLSTDTVCDLFDVPLASRDISNLGAGASSSASTSVTIPANTATGSYYICMWADAFYNAIHEFDENNNAEHYAISITSVAPIFSDGFETGTTSAWSSTAP